MKIPARGSYGIRALVDLALRGQSGPVLVRDIATRQQISILYLQQLLNPLIAGGLVRSTRGPGGGVSLSKPASDIKLIDVLQLLIGDIAPVACVNNPDSCPRSPICATRDIWVQLSISINGILTGTTIQDLVDRQKMKNKVSDVGSYQI
jgi:Rrf2 family cysteine metabolism transcriptional repressor